MGPGAPAKRKAAFAAPLTGPSEARRICLLWASWSFLQTRHNAETLAFVATLICVWLTAWFAVRLPEKRPRVIIAVALLALNWALLLLYYLPGPPQNEILTTFSGFLLIYIGLLLLWAGPDEQSPANGARIGWLEKLPLHLFRITVIGFGTYLVAKRIFRLEYGYGTLALAIWGTLLTIVGYLFIWAGLVRSIETAVSAVRSVHGWVCCWSFMPAASCPTVSGMPAITGPLTTATWSCNLGAGRPTSSDRFRSSLGPVGRNRRSGRPCARGRTGPGSARRSPSKWSPTSAIHVALAGTRVLRTEGRVHDIVPHPPLAPPRPIFNPRRQRDACGGSTGRCAPNPPETKRDEAI